ncbi:MAG: hypothetical protein V4653_10540 [Pseudomonadota bacterium]
MTALVVGAAERAQLQELRERAAAAPVDMPRLVEWIKTDGGKRQHLAQMNRQSIPLPFGFMVTLSIEVGHPVGTCRHMSMSVLKDGRVPHPEALWMVAEQLGFIGSLHQCQAWIEDLSDGGKAVNIVQPVAVTPEGAA